MNNYIESGYAIGVIDKEMSDTTVNEVYSFILKHHGAGIAPLETVEKVLKAHLLESVAEAYLK